MLLELPMTKTPKKPKSTTKTALNTKHIEYKKLESLCRSQHKFIVSLEKKAEATDKKTKSIHKRWTAVHNKIVGWNREWQEAYAKLEAAYEDCLKKNDEFVVQEKELKKTHEEITTAYLQETFGQIPMRKFREYNIKTMDKKIKKKIN